jgi:uncharacterized damage-inducible protein DinB
MKTTDTLTTLFQHNHWANLAIVAACRDLSEAQLNSTINGTFGSIYETLHHMATSEQSYFSRISTGQPKRYPDDAPRLTLAQIHESLQTTGAGFVEWATKVPAADLLNIDWDGEPRKVPKSIIMTQVINHATEHRAQIMAILTQLGITPPELDSWSYFDYIYRSA